MNNNTELELAAAAAAQALVAELAASTGISFGGGGGFILGQQQQASPQQQQQHLILDQLFHKYLTATGRGGDGVGFPQQQLFDDHHPSAEETTDDILYETMIANNRGEHDHSPLIHNNNNGGSEANGNNALYRRNNYRELCRFDSDAAFEAWLTREGRNWGIVQKGRATIEDLIDQYACVFKRRKGYSCRASMRVRHSRTSCRKVVEVSTQDHHHVYSRERHDAQVAEKEKARGGGAAAEHGEKGGGGGRRSPANVNNNHQPRRRGRRTSTESPTEAAAAVDFYRGGDGGGDQDDLHIGQANDEEEDEDDNCGVMADGRMILKEEEEDGEEAHDHHLVLGGDGGGEAAAGHQELFPVGDAIFVGADEYYDRGKAVELDQQQQQQNPLLPSNLNLNGLNPMNLNHLTNLMDHQQFWASLFINSQPPQQQQQEKTQMPSGMVGGLGMVERNGGSQPKNDGFGGQQQQHQLLVQGEGGGGRDDEQEGYAEHDAKEDNANGVANKRDEEEHVEETSNNNNSVMERLSTAITEKILTHLTAHLDARLAPLVSAISLLANGFEGLKQHIQAFHHNLEGGPDSQQTTINDGGDVHWMTALGPLLQQQQQLQQQQPSTSMVIQREEEGEGGNRSATSKYNPKNSQKKARKNATTVKNITADLLKNPSSSCEVQIPSHDKQGRPHPLKSGPFLAPTTTIIKTPLPLPPVLQVDHNHPNGCNGSVRGGGARTLVEIGIERELHEEEEGGEGENAGNLYANFPYSTTPLNGGQRPQNNKKRWKPRAVGVEQHQRGLNEGVRGAKPTKKKGAKRKATTVTATGLSSSPTKKKPCLRRCHFSSAGGGGATAASSSEKQHPFTLLSAAGPGANSSTSTATTAAATLVLRKSVQAYRQRRRELSYRHFKEVGMMLSIYGQTKSLFEWNPEEIRAVCQQKHQELVGAGVRVVYRGRDITAAIYRVDCSRDMVNGRRCGQMLADALWPQGFFQSKMMMPILQGVYHRTKKRVNGSSRGPIDVEQFEIFKVALLLLGGWLMAKPDRFRWMETAREGVNQRGLDELSNSKRAHFVYEGGPVFSSEKEGEDGDSPTTEKGKWEEEEGTTITNYVQAAAHFFPDTPPSLDDADDDDRQFFYSNSGFDLGLGLSHGVAAEANSDKFGMFDTTIFNGRSVSGGSYNTNNNFSSSSNMGVTFSSWPKEEVDVLDGLVLEPARKLRRKTTTHGFSENNNTTHGYVEDDQQQVQQQDDGRPLLVSGGGGSTSKLDRLIESLAERQQLLTKNKSEDCGSPQTAARKPAMCT